MIHGDKWNNRSVKAKKKEEKKKENDRQGKES